MNGTSLILVFSLVAPCQSEVRVRGTPFGLREQRQRGPQPLAGHPLSPSLTPQPRLPTVTSAF